MIRVVIFDLGGTLIDANNHPFPHAVDALTAISGFMTADGKPLRSCLVSDYTMATVPVTVAKVTAIFNQYLELLDGTGLRPFFEPVKKRVTLSTQAGSMKPDKKIFAKAIERLGVAVALKDCLFITENAEHVERARTQLHMQALRFRVPGSAHFDFEDWSQAPALIAHLVAPQHFENTLAALKPHLAAKGIELLNAQPSKVPGKIQVSGQVWQNVSVPGFDDLQNLHVAVPVAGQIARGQRGEFKPAPKMKPSPEDIAEAASFVGSLAKHGQIEGRTVKTTFQPTHAIETDEQGNKKLIRKRFTAF
jgi:FMN phosphatase YigB (HAD superfamily)